MWKLPFRVFDTDAWSDQIFENVDECLEKYSFAITNARKQVLKQRMTVGKFLIFRTQVIALPPEYFDQRLLGIGDVAEAQFDENRPKYLVFE